jgi:hypothetical protein
VNDLEKGPSSGRSARQKSMDMDLSSPYLLPPNLQDSRESLSTLSRKIDQHEDPYRPVTQIATNDTASIRSLAHGNGDNASIYTRSSAAPSRMNESANLLQNAAAMSRTNPSPHLPRQDSLPHSSPSSSPIESPNSQAPPKNLLPAMQTKGLPASLRPGSMITPTSPLSAIENLASQLPQEPSPPSQQPVPIIKMPEPAATALPTPGPTLQQTPARKTPPTLNTLTMANEAPRPDRNESLPVVQPPRESVMSEQSDYGAGFHVTPPSPTQEMENRKSRRYSMDVPPEEFAAAGLGAPGFDPARLSMTLRPLPPNEAIESEDPEARANRIRSFYKEYFDESKPAPKGQYYEDYDQNYLGDAGYFDSEHNNFVMPYAEPVTRRAMTPPPRGPRFQGPPRNMHGSMGGRSMMESPGPRAQSSVSNRGGPPPKTKKPLPPPSPLNTLPTPAQLRDDSFALMGSIDFAPPTTYKERQAGIRPDSPMGDKRPYSPMVRPHTPLVSAFDELSAMPSP